MPSIASALLLSCAWALAAAVQPAAATTAAAGTPAQAWPRGQADASQGAPAPANAATAATTPPGALPARKSHLRFKGPDSACGCTCASGGTTERAIQEAHEARQSAARR
jgi:hypothetical protein